MNHLSRRAAFAGLMVLAACATNSVTEEPPETPDDGVHSDGGSAADGASDANDGGRDVDPDAERPLICGKTGYCETRLPRSDVGEPLSLRSVWVVGSNDVWTVSAEGFVLHWDGAAWTTAYRAGHALYAVWATATDVWAAGERGLLLHSTPAVDGGAWTRVETGHAKDIRGIYGSAANDVWFGYDGAVQHYDGSALTSYDLGNPALRAHTVFGRAGYGTYALYDEVCTSCIQFPTARTFVFELVPGHVAEVNTILSQAWGTFPTSAVVTDSPDEEYRFFVFGYETSTNAWNFVYRNFGKLTSSRPLPVELEDVAGRVLTVGAGDPGDPTYPPPPLLMSLARDGVDVRVQGAIGIANRWDGTTFAPAPAIDMGFDFVPRQLFAIHENKTDMWLVGDGFALKGPTP